MSRRGQTLQVFFVLFGNTASFFFFSVVSSLLFPFYDNRLGQTGSHAQRERPGEGEKTVFTGEWANQLVELEFVFLFAVLSVAAVDDLPVIDCYKKEERKMSAAAVALLFVILRSATVCECVCDLMIIFSMHERQRQRGSNFNKEWWSVVISMHGIKES